MNNKRGTQITKEQRLRNHIVPFFGKMRLDEIRVRQIESVPSIQPMKVPKPEWRFLEEEDAIRLVEAAEPGLERTMIIVALKAGLRIGELCGLRCKDVDFQRRHVHVRQSFYRGHIDTPKNDLSRTIPLTDELRAPESGSQEPGDRPAQWHYIGAVERRKL